MKDDPTAEWLDSSVDNLQGSETPREWLAKAVIEAVDRCNKLQGDSSWLYSLAVTMVPAYPDIVKGTHVLDGQVSFTFDWKAVQAIFDATLRDLILEC